MDGSVDYDRRVTLSITISDPCDDPTIWTLSEDADMIVHVQGSANLDTVLTN